MNPKKMTNKHLVDATCEATSLEDLGSLGQFQAELLRRLNEADQYKKIADEGRHAGREEALNIIMSQDAEMPFEHETESRAEGDSGDYSYFWKEDKLRELLDIETPGEMSSTLDRVEGCYWEQCEKIDDLNHEAFELRMENAALRKENEELASILVTVVEVCREVDAELDHYLIEDCLMAEDALSRRAARLAKESEVKK